MNDYENDGEALLRVKELRGWCWAVGGRKNFKSRSLTPWIHEDAYVTVSILSQ